MSDGSMVPVVDLVRVESSHRSMGERIASLGDADVRRPSLLPGWTVGHVLTHLARNADSHIRRAHAAAEGRVTDQYVGGYEGRARDIESGAGRSAAAIVADVAGTNGRLTAVWRELPASAWSVVSRDVGGTERALSELPGRRWQEVEVHLVDLGVGVTHRDWPDEFVEVWLPRLRTSLARRLPEGDAPPAGELDLRDELAWLYGRHQPEGYPTLAPWG